MSNPNKNTNLSQAKQAKHDEFYTQYQDIEREISAYFDFDNTVFLNKIILLPCDDPEWSNFTLYFARNFDKLGLKKLISTSFSQHGGKICVITKDTCPNHTINLKDLTWKRLNGTGDFRSDEIIALRDEADIIITNPPFSLFREFLTWIMNANKKFAIIGNKNCVTYKEVFPLIKDNQLWSGREEWAGGMWFETSYDDVDKVINGVNLKNIPSIWITNLEHGRRHQPLPLLTMAENLACNKKLVNKYAYQEYDNYHAIEVPYTNAIPSDYDGVMGVPISFLDKHNPEQFEIVASDYQLKTGQFPTLIKSDWEGKLDRGYLNNQRMYSRLLIRLKKASHC